jgi:YHS domain-containing protein
MPVIAKVRNRTKGYTGEMYWLCSEHMFMQLENNPKVSSRDFVENLRMPDGRRPIRWRGITFVPYPELPGAGSASCKTFLFAKTSVHYHASEQPFIADFDNRHRKYFCNAQVMHAGVLALPKGVERFLHDDTATFAA